MGDYVDRKRLKEAIREDALNCLSCYNGEVLDLVLMDIDEVPAADVRPVVRGRWEWMGPCRDNGGRLWATCSACGERQRLGDYTSFCPHCGADMRGSDQ